MSSKNKSTPVHLNSFNPSTGAAIKIKASKAPAFKAGATLKAAVNGAKK